MGGSMSRNKGQRGEREVIKLLQPVVIDTYARAGLTPPELERNLVQSHKGGHDIVGLEWIALEVKFQETLQIELWWDQTKLQAERASKKHIEQVLPVLFYRKSRSKWNVRMFGGLRAGNQMVRCPVEISVEAFLAWFRLELERRLA